MKKSAAHKNGFEVLVYHVIAIWTVPVVFRHIPVSANTASAAWPPTTCADCLAGAGASGFVMVEKSIIIQWDKHETL